MGVERNAYRILLGKPGEKRPLGRPRCMWVDNVNMFLESRMRWHGMDSSGSGQGPVEDSFDHGNVPSGSIQFWEVLV
jgi:hypothetical protein